jgi:hypothetical protein
MNFMKKISACIQLDESAARAVAVLVLLAFGSAAAMAQSVPANMNVFDGSGSARYKSTGRAFTGDGNGDVNGAPGKVVVSYTHKVYSSTPPTSITIKYYNGTVFSASPLAGRRLGYEIL